MSEAKHEYTDDVISTICRLLAKWNGDQGANTKELRLLEQALVIQLEEVRESIRLREVDYDA